ncbi:restriction endonuclease subunit S [Acinetobacter sp. ANC 7201]|nr:restriction endonuclease subunit S [Acinetobacter sp. ANC 7201]WFP97719.1 restriction endonuclease subunit S [Acinetobacter sp. ANC 7201]
MAAPKLRFKEFSEDYNFSKFQEASIQIIDGDRGNNYPKSDDFYDNEYCLFLNAGNVTKSGFKFESTQFINKEKDALLRKGKLQKNDLVITTRGTVGNIAYFDESIPFENIRINSGMVIVRSEIDLEPIYLNQFLKSDLFEKWLEKNVFGSAQPQLTVKLLNSISISYPSKEEQIKITSFLSAVDEKISQLTQKHELLSQYKQGMMQKLFSQQIRFKADDGSEFGEWASEKISKVFTNKSKSFNPLLNESLPCIELEHLSQNTGQILGTVNSSDQQSTKNLFEPNSVLYGKLRPYLRKFAKPQFKGVCSSEIWVLTGLKISNDYLFQFVQSEQFTELTNIQSGSKMPRADWNVIADSEIEFPCLEEQTKIANFLSAIDQKVEVVAQQIKQAKTWKKGLLQQMFV